MHKSNIREEYVVKIAQYFDEYLYGNPSEEALCFHNGIYTIKKRGRCRKDFNFKFCRKHWSHNYQRERENNSE